ncbi:glycosyltransferase family 1 protein [Bacillus thuringiensis]
MAQIKILYILGAFGSGGVESVVSNVHQNIDHSRFKIDFVLFNGLDHSRKSDLEKYGSKVYFIERSGKGIIKFISETYKILRKERYDVIHAHTNEAALFSAIAGVLARTPERICHSHNTSFGKNERIVPFFRVPFKLFSTHLFACSKLAGTALFGEKANFTVINNAIDVKKYTFKPAIREKVKKSLGLEGKFVIGNVGRLSYQKNHSFILEIYKKVVALQKDTVLLLIGDGELEADIKNKVHQLGLENNVLFLGARGDVNELLQVMDVFLLPSHYEGLPVSLIEAQSAGLPCIASDAITNEVKITNLVEFLSLDSPADYWAEMVLKYSKGYQRKDMFDEMKRAGYEMGESVKRVQMLYEGSVEEEGV